MLDPRRKSAKICPRILSTHEAVKLLSEEAERFLNTPTLVLPPPNDPASDPNSASESDEWYGAFPRLTTVPFEVTKYLASPCQQPTVDPLQWWKVHSHDYPILAIAAKAILAVPATSVPSEEAFSAAGRVGDDSRGSLRPGTLSEQVCLKSWMPLFD